MHSKPQAELITRKYREVFGASARPVFAVWLQAGRHEGADALFLEACLDRPMQQIVGESIGRPIRREAIVEIGNFAAAMRSP